MNKNIIFLISLLLVAVLQPLYAQAPQKSWTLEECIQYAIDNNIQIDQGFD